jgi:hypothetical protein
MHVNICTYTIPQALLKWKTIMAGICIYVYVYVYNLSIYSYKHMYIHNSVYTCFFCKKAGNRKDSIISACKLIFHVEQCYVNNYVYQ